MTTESKKHYPIRRTRQNRDQDQGGNRHYGAARKPHETEQQTQAELAPRRERRALSHVGGDVHFQGGQREEHDVLLAALDVSADEEQVMADVHGFHSYPARLHPKTARGLIEGFSKPGDRVLDPFCGSGTVVVEGRALGREAIGSDLNPLAVELSWLKSRGPTEKLVQDMLRSAARIAEVAEERRIAKADPYKRYMSADLDRYPVHILLELDSISHGIGLLAQPEVIRMLRLVVSSMLTKLSFSEGDTTRQRAPRRLPSGFAIQLFHQKAEELARRFDAYRARLPERAIRAYVGMSDARSMEKIEDDSIDLIITSPPYPGVYDYLEHHMHRIEWLGLRAHGLAEGEIGARREYRQLRVEDAAARWRSEIGPTLYELRRTLAPGGRGVMVIADSVVDRHPLRADEQIRRVADKAGIEITCIASQERPLFLYGADRAFANGPRMEHVVVFRPGERPHIKARSEKHLKAAEEERRNHERPQRFWKQDDERFEQQEREREEEARRARRPSGPRGGAGGGFRPRDDGPRGGAGGGFRPRDDGPRGSGGGGFRPRDDGPRGGAGGGERRSFRSNDESRGSSERPRGGGPPRGPRGPRGPRRPE